MSVARGLFLAAITACTTVAHADVIVAFVPEAGGPPSPWADATGTPPATTVHPSVTASVLDRVGLAEQGSDTAAVYPGWAPSTSTLNDYTTFTVTPNAGVAMTLDSLSYALESYGAMNDAEGYGMRVRTSLDNFAAVVASQTIRNASSGVFNLNLASLPDSVTVPVEFRIYITNFFAAAGRADVTALNGGLVLNGSVEAVPEPASTLLLGLGLVSTWILERRRR